MIAPRGGWRVDALLVVGFVLVTVLVWIDRFDYWDLVVRDWAGWSYPSGHVVNTLIWAPVVLLLLSALVAVPPWLQRFTRVFPVVAVGVAMIFLGYHWMTDVLGALFVGGALDRALRRVPWLPSVSAEPRVGADHDAR